MYLPLFFTLFFKLLETSNLQTSADDDPQKKYIFKIFDTKEVSTHEIIKYPWIGDFSTQIDSEYHNRVIDDKHQVKYEFITDPIQKVDLYVPHEYETTKYQEFREVKFYFGQKLKIFEKKTTTTLKVNEKILINVTVREVKQFIKYEGEYVQLTQPEFFLSDFYTDFRFESIFLALKQSVKFRTFLNNYKTISKGENNFQLLSNYIDSLNCTNLAQIELMKRIFRVFMSFEGEKIVIEDPDLMLPMIFILLLRECKKFEISYEEIPFLFWTIEKRICSISQASHSKRKKSYALLPKDENIAISDFIRCRLLCSTSKIPKKSKSSCLSSLQSHIYSSRVPDLLFLQFQLYSENFIFVKRKISIFIEIKGQGTWKLISFVIKKRVKYFTGCLEGDDWFLINTRKEKIENVEKYLNSEPGLLVCVYEKIDE